MSDVIDLYSPEALMRRLERSLAQCETDKRASPVAAKEAPAPVDPAAPRDCVRQFPCVGDMAVELVGFDSEGVARISIKFGRDVPLAGWEEWITRWVRKRYGRRVLALVD